MNLIDKENRWLHKLRIQLTDVCNFRCFYCMPRNAKFLPRDELLSCDEIFNIASNLVKFGVDEVRLTGGEPTVRSDFREIVSGLSCLPLSKLGLTTNGFVLKRHLSFLKSTSLKHINISCDSLREDRFQDITRTGHFRAVMESIRSARDAGFLVKLNCILFRGKNDDEILDFVKFSEVENIEIRFLEYMRIGPQYEASENLFYSAQETLARIAQERALVRVRVAKDSTSFRYNTDRGGRLGFIASESRPFCSTCSRLRLTAKGVLRACLMSEKGISLRGLPLSSYPEVLPRVMSMKPTGRLVGTLQPMYQIGG